MKKTLALLSALMFASPVYAHASYHRTGMASWYGPGFYGHKTASGAVYTGRRMTAAHNSLPLGSLARVSYKHRSIIVRITDRGSFGRKYHRLIDLSPCAARRLHIMKTGTAKVTIVALRTK